MTGYRNLYEYVNQLAQELGSLYSGNRHDKSNVLEFMDNNEWFGLNYTMKELAPWIKEQNLLKIKGSLCLWLLAYKKSEHEKTMLLLEHFKAVYPDTCRLFRKFLTDQSLWDSAAPWKLLDFLFSELDKDITELDEKELEAFISNANSNATKVTVKLLADFLVNSKISYWTYAIGKRDAPERINHAYSFTDFSVMAYCIFNSEVWSQQGMIEKAVANKTYADLWLFTALHFTCALRKSDMKRLPAPALPYAPETIFRMVLDGSFNKITATALVEDLTIRLQLKSMKPSKTAKASNVPELKIFVPESLKEPLGIIIAIVLAHHPEIHAGDGFVNPSDNLENIRKFFGKPFADALGNRRFSSRRSNKSYIQGIEMIGSDEPGQPKGYMLAALARSHKSGIGNLAETTEVYLKDARFSGYNPEFIIRQMFERGVFSFISAALLEIYAGTDYKKLPIISQTKLIGELGLSAYQIEGLVETVDRAMIKSREAVATIVNNTASMDGHVSEMLQKIAAGSAVSKQDECLCLVTAAGKSCIYPSRGGCICCGYEIYTKTTMHTLMREYSRLIAAKKSANKNDAMRYGKILEQAILPAAAQILTSSKLLYPDADISGLLDIMEVEFHGNGNGTRGIE